MDRYTKPKNVYYPPKRRWTGWILDVAIVAVIVLVLAGMVYLMVR